MKNRVWWASVLLAAAAAGCRAKKAPPAPEGVAVPTAAATARPRPSTPGEVKLEAKSEAWLKAKAGREESMLRLEEARRRDDAEFQRRRKAAGQGVQTTASPAGK
jgi:hypothetical protein